MVRELSEKEEHPNSESQKKISEIKDFYQSILDGIMSGVWVTNDEDIIFYTNNGMEKIAGIPAEKIIGARVLLDFPESTLKLFRPHYLKAKKSLKPVYYDDVPIVTPVGRQSYQSGWLIPRIIEGNYGGMICTVEDTTDRKTAEFRLKTYQTNLEELVHQRSTKLKKVNKQLYYEVKEHKKTYSELTQILNSSIPICVIDKNHEIIRINDTYANFFRTHTENVIGKKCYEIMHYDNCHTPICTLKQILNGAIIVESEKIKKFNDNDEIYYLARSTPYKDSEGNVIGMVETYTDITQRIRIENAIIESEEKYRLITETAHDLIRVVNERFKIEYINEPAHQKLLGYNKDEFIKKMRPKILHPDEIKAGIKFLRQIKKDGEAVREGRFRHKNGHWIWFEVKGRKFLDKDGNEKMLFISRDISERKKYEKMLKEFIVIASHQLRTPVSALVQSLDNLKKYDTQLDEETKVKLVDIISRNVSRLSKLVEVLLDFSEIDDKTILSSKIHKALKKEEEEFHNEIN